MNAMYLVLQDGHFFKGKAFGAAGETAGELVFTTGTGGYQKTLCDPRHFGQIIVQTFPQIGNYGILNDPALPMPAARGYVVREWCEHPSNFQSVGTIDAYLKEKGIVGICGIDTRELTRILREQGTVTAAIVQSIDPFDKSKLQTAPVNTNAVQAASIQKKQTIMPRTDAKYQLVLLDFGGYKHTILQALLNRGCTVTTVPFDTSAEEILSLQPNGIVLSGGPGNPAVLPQCVGQLQMLFGRMPLLGIGLGHQLLALAAGAKTERMHTGHHGANVPVKDVQTGRVYITNQNHSYVVCAHTVSEAGGVVRYKNVNDDSCAGIDYPQQRAFSIQFDPDNTPGASGTAFVFDRLLSLIEGGPHA